RDVRGTAPRSCIGSSRNLFGLNRLQDSALRPSRRFARSARKAFTFHEESVSYRRPITRHCKAIPHKQCRVSSNLGAIKPAKHRHPPPFAAKNRHCKISDRPTVVVIVGIPLQ